MNDRERKLSIVGLTLKYQKENPSALRNLENSLDEDLQKFQEGSTEDMDYIPLDESPLEYGDICQVCGLDVCPYCRKCENSYCDDIGCNCTTTIESLEEDENI